MNRIKILFSFMLLILLSSWNTVNLESLTITGTVTDASDSSPLPGVTVLIKNSSTGTITDMEGKYEIKVPSEKTVLMFSLVGYLQEEIIVDKKKIVDVQMKADVQSLSEVVVVGYAAKAKHHRNKMVAPSYELTKSEGIYMSDQEEEKAYSAPYNTEEYSTVHENTFLDALENPLSTFSIDVDKASYSNMRRFIANGQKPPKDAIRIEEMINYFSYNYPQPTGEDPFSVNTEVAECPWNKEHLLVQIGLQGKKIATENLPASNLVFLIDVSGSMQDPNKLPLLKAAFKLLVKELRPQDNISLVVYAGAAGVVLPSTSGEEKAKILAALDNLEAGGSTAGGAGIKLAYKLAEDNFKKEGNNRVILATDGDFNIGASSNAEMERLIEEKRETGVFLTVLGFGMGNYKDSKMETLADKGNGNYAYIDNIMEAKKIFVNEFGGTLFTIAKDVKLQIEFNPAKVKGYRLLGYENRALKNEDFNNDKKDAGELGAGHTVTAFYEIIPFGAKADPFLHEVDNLKYQSNEKVNPNYASEGELMTIKLRYKRPESNTSKLITEIVGTAKLSTVNTSNNFRFAAAVASFGMLLRDSDFKGDSNYTEILKMAKSAKGKDEEGYRTEFLNLVKSAQLMAAD